MRELKNQHADFFFDQFALAEKRFAEQLRIQKMLVVLASLVAKTREIGEAFQGDGVGDFDAKAKRSGHLRAQASEVFLRGEFVVTGVKTDSRERLGIFRKAVALEPRFGEFAARDVARLVINLAAPFRIFP